MSEFNKYSTDGGATFIDVEDSNAVHWADNAVLGAKNLADFNNAVTASTTYGGLTYTNNNDGLFIVNGTKDSSSTGTTSISLIENFKIANGRYLITDGINNRPASTHFRINGYYAGSSTRDWNVASTDQNGGLFIVDGTYDHFQLQIEIKNNVTYDNLTFYPMIRLASDTDDTYAPYAMTNRELTDKLTPIDISSSISLGTMFEGKTSSTSIYAKKSGNMVDVAFLIKPSEEITIGTWGSGIILTGFPNYINNQLFNIPISVNNNIVTYGQMQIRNNVNGLELTAGYTFPADAEIKIQFVYMAS